MRRIKNEIAKKVRAGAISAAGSLMVAGMGLVAVSGEALANPAPVKREAPEYPKGAEKRGIEGWVSLKFNVDATGNVVSPQVVEASPPGVFDAAAIDAISKWKYESGAATPDMQIKLSFKLQ